MNVGIILAITGFVLILILTLTGVSTSNRSLKIFGDTAFTTVVIGGLITAVVFFMICMFSTISHRWNGPVPMSTQQLMTVNASSDEIFSERFYDDSSKIFETLAQSDNLRKPVVFYRQDLEDYSNYFPAIRNAYRDGKIYLADLSNSGGQNLQKIADAPQGLSAWIYKNGIWTQIGLKQALGCQCSGN